MRSFSIALLILHAVGFSALAGVSTAAAQEPTSSPASAPGASVVGVVTDGWYTPVEGVSVTAGDVATRTAADGSYRLEPLPPGPTTITFTPPTARHEPTQHTLTLRQGSTAYLDVILTEHAIPIEVVAGQGRIATAVAASRRGFPDGADTAVLASAAAFPDALAAAPLAARHDAPLLLVAGRTGAVVAGEIARLRANQVIIVGAVAAVPAIVQAELEHSGLSVRRIAGDGRFDTAGLIARELGAGPDGEAIVVSGRDFADAMSAGPLAAAAGIPILLTAPQSLPEDTAQALTDIGATSTLVIGGPAAVADDVAARLPQPRRIAGRDRFETSVAVAEALESWYGGSPDTVFVATGRDFPDGLTAAPVAAQGHNPLLLVDGQDPQHGEQVYDYLESRLAGIDVAVVFGGDRAVTPRVRARLARPYLDADQL